MRKEKADVIVIGAGVLGLLTARELARAGLDVLVLDRGQPGREASRAAAGILSPLYPWRISAPLQALAHWSQQYYPVLVDDIHRDSGIDSQLANSGMLIFDEGEQYVAQAWARYHALPIESLTADQVRWCEPGLVAASDRTAVYLPTVSHINSSRFMRALTEHVYARGVPIRIDTEVSGLLTANGRVAGVTTAAGDIQADKVVVTAGAWSGALLKSAGILLEIEPVRGQVIQYDGPPGLLSRILMKDGFYIVPRRNGRLVVGSTVERVGFDTEVTEQSRQELIEAAVGLLPALDGLPVQRQWSGLRPGTGDELPYIGEHPDVDGLFLNTGHFRHGLTTAPASARLLTDMLVGRSPILDPSAYRLLRQP